MTLKEAQNLRFNDVVWFVDQWDIRKAIKGKIESLYIEQDRVSARVTNSKVNPLGSDAMHLTEKEALMEARASQIKVVERHAKMSLEELSRLDSIERRIEALKQ